MRFALVILALLVFSKYFYMASFTSYFTFYLIEKFGLSVANSQLYLFLFLGASRRAPSSVAPSATGSAARR